MSCGTDDGNASLRWRSERNNAYPDLIPGEKYIVISSGPDVMDGCASKNFMIDHRVKGQFDLLVKAELGNANAYTCLEPGIRDAFFSAEMIVLSMRLNSLPVFCMFEVERKKF